MKVKKFTLLGLLCLLLFAPHHSWAQLKKIKGTVSDPSGLPLAGVTVSIKNQTKATATDGSGAYQLEAQVGDLLEFSMLGFNNKEVTVGQAVMINVILTESAKALEEVIVVGYGAQKKVNLTGSVATVSAKQIQNRPLTNLASALSGTASGVYVNQSSGQPGNESVSIRIMGTGTLNSASPLVLVDGIEAPINNINPNDVENISVLKDAAAASIYGSRAANGVILVTTKKGKTGKPRLSYSVYSGIQKMPNSLNMITDFPTVMGLINESRINMGDAIVYKPEFIQSWRDSSAIDPIRWPNTDWFSFLFKNGSMQEHNLSVNGGTENITYNVSLNYLQNQGMISSTSYKRYGLRMNIDGKISDRIKTGTNFAINTGLQKGPADISSLFTFMSSPDIYPKHPDGRYGAVQDGANAQTNNALARLELEKSQNQKLDLTGIGYVQVELLKDLFLKGNAGIRYGQNNSSTFQMQADLWNFRTGKNIQPVTTPGNSLFNSFDKNYTLTLFPTLNYSVTLKNAHALSALAGYSQEFYKRDYFGGSGSKIFSPETPVLATALDNIKTEGAATEWAMKSFFGRLNYDYKGRYLLEANLRADGSSRFAPGNRWGYFPSFSAAWRITEEKFAAGLRNYVDNIKLRGSWGKLGNNNTNPNNYTNGNDYAYQSLYNASGVNYNFGGSVAGGIAPTALVNQGISWESTTIKNVGMDMDFFKSKLHVEANYFNKITNGILYTLDVPDYIGGLGGPVVNLAEVTNKGWELSTQYSDKIGKVELSIGGNITHVDNEVSKFRGENIRAGSLFIIQEGYPISSIFGYQAAGIFRSADEVMAAPVQKVISGNSKVSTSPGDIRYTDVNGDNKITSDDRKVIGNVLPKYTFGLNLSVKAYGFELSTIFNGVYKQDAYLNSNFYTWQAEGSTARRINAKWMDRWTPDNANAELPRLTTSKFTDNNMNSSFWVQDASFLRLKNVQLTYNIPSKFVQKIKLSDLKVYINAQNLFTITNFDGFDPERTSTNTNIEHPNVKVFSMGINTSF
ncbi:SusC/RagA family TonB-linked outer membrane protein [Solitalea lacus]|uniref:SusC/RagA family TonB-linked outer membrane protein n=1 Tax=Solitalea lacus TaxID=2911172 RepID=UPI001EDB2D8D|nr:TonB-dependent receptor [Solitalea lacus]UKJ07441.1 TonB-dependent receptor [Solitalea lacus]